MMASVILSTYNSVAWLEKVLWGFHFQNRRDFEIVIADDGSTSETRAKVDEMRERTGLAITHVWHEDDGFRKTVILNKAILASASDYLIFTDGDCIPRADFVDTHLRYRRENCFLSGGYFKLPMNISQQIDRDDIEQQRCFDSAWLRAQGLPAGIKLLKLIAKGAGARALNALTPTKATWNGQNASGWKSDLLAVDGFNEQMQYGGEDRELGERLFNMGLTSRQIRYSAICVHLDHARGYVSEEAWQKNHAIRAETKRNKVVRTSHGISAGKATTFEQAGAMPAPARTGMEEQ